ncbi:MAG: hypothetical protein HW402_1399 [Dehalococcoidales bacterium]|nr:hypothetical protein [Dehalococcoidales bacterium]
MVGESVFARPSAAGGGEAIRVEGFVRPDCHVATPAMTVESTISKWNPKIDSMAELAYFGYNCTMSGNVGAGGAGQSLGRRDFLRGVALISGLTVLSSLMPACLSGSQQTAELSHPTEPTALPTPQTKEAGMTKVALVRTMDRGDGVRQAVNLLDLKSFRGKDVVLKPNFNSADPAPGSTHSDTLRSLITSLQQMEAKQITLSERSGPGDSTRVVMEKKGIFKLAEELGFGILNLEEMAPEGWIQFKPKESHWSQGFHFPRIYLEAESIVQTCCLKTHAYGGHFTLSLKNAVGLVPRAGYPYMGELHSSPYQRQLIAELNTAYSPDLVVLDGVEAFVNGGPARGTRVDAGVMLAGTDRVAIDATGVAILRLLGTTAEVSRGSVFAQDQIARAAELGLGVSSAKQIQLVTGDAESQAFARQIQDILLR